MEHLGRSGLGQTTFVMTCGPWLSAFGGIEIRIGLAIRLRDQYPTVKFSLQFDDPLAMSSAFHLAPTPSSHERVG